MTKPVTVTSAPATFAPVADARVNANNPTTNYGNETTIKAKGGSSPNNSYLKFDLSGLSGRTPVGGRAPDSAQERSSSPFPLTRVSRPTLPRT